MPRKADPLRAQIKALTELIKLDRAEQRAAEAPVRAARRELTEALRRGTRAVDRANQKLADLIYDAAFLHREPWGIELRPAEEALVIATKLFNERLIALQTFDAIHGVEADYPTLPALDREATKATAHANYDREMASMRERYGPRSARAAPPPTNPLNALFAPMPGDSDEIE
jgi:hypothetical protein